MKKKLIYFFILVFVILTGSLLFASEHFKSNDYEERLPLEEVEFAAKKLMKNTRIVNIEPLVLPGAGEIIGGYEFVFSRKDSIDINDLLPAIKDKQKFSQAAQNLKSDEEIYKLLVKSEGIDYNNSIFNDYFYTLVMTSDINEYPELFRYKGLPMTLKLKISAEEKMPEYELDKTCVKEERFLFLKIGFINYYFETNEGDKYFMSPEGKFFKVKSFSDLELKKISKKTKTEESKDKAREKWFELLDR